MLWDGDIKEVSSMKRREYVQVSIFEAALVLLKEIIQYMWRSAQGHSVVRHGSTDVKLLVVIFLKKVDDVVLVFRTDSGGPCFISR